MLGSVLFYVVIAVLIFGVLIATHELGHFATAKLLGVQVNEFAVGMGPALWKKEKGETLYSIRALPIGGYCAMEGEDEESDNPRAFGRAQRVEKDRHPLRRGFHEFSDRLCADPDPFFPGHRFRAAHHRRLSGGLRCGGQRAPARGRGLLPGRTPDLQL